MTEADLSRTTQAGLVFGKVEVGAALEIESTMPENGVIFSDGIEADTMEFNAGTIDTNGVASRNACFVVPGDL